LERREDLDIGVEITGHFRAPPQERTQKPRLHGGRELHHVVDCRHLVKLGLVELEIVDGDEIERLVAGVEVRICIDDQYSQTYPGIVTRQGSGQDARVRQVVRRYDGAHPHLPTPPRGGAYIAEAFLRGKVASVPARSERGTATSSLRSSG